MVQPLEMVAIGRRLRSPAPQVVATARAVALGAALLAGVSVAAPAAAQDPAQPEQSDAARPDPDLALVRDAVVAYRRGDLAAGDAIRGRVSGAGGKALLDWVAVRFGGAAVSFDRVTDFALAYPDFPNPAWLRRRIEETLVAERKPASVLRSFFARERPQTAAGTLALAQALRADGLEEDAAELIRDAWRADTFGPELELKILSAFKDTLRTEDHRFRMERFLLRENWAAARRAASYAGPGYDALVKARAAVGGRSKVAPKLVEAVPASLKGDTSWLYSRVQNLRRSKKPGEAAKLLLEVTRDPAVLAEGDVWWVERRLIARELLDEDDPKTAYAVAAGHGATGAERRIEAEFLAGWIALRFLNDAKTARMHFDRAATVAGTPISRARVGYWQGRAAEALGAGEESKRFYEAAASHGIAYYGQLAAAKLGRDRVAVRPASDPGSPERRTAAATPLVQAVGIAYAANLRELASPLAVEFGRGSTRVAELEAVGEIVSRNDDPRTLLTVGKLSTQRGLPLDEAAFPTDGVPPFEPHEPQVEPAMVAAIARQESAFDPTAGSHAGARGLMQLMPGTALATAKKVGERYEPGRILEAAYNARLGAAHLGHLMEDWNGAYVLVFASYNAGPGNARKWIKAYGDPRDPAVDPVDWVERIPFSETRNYVQRVMENLQVYRRRLEGRDALHIDRDMKQGGFQTASSAGPAKPNP